MSAVPGEPSVKELLVFAEGVAREAGGILRDRFGKLHDVQYKGTIDVVTEADKAAEAVIADRIRTVYPDHDLVGEEGARALPGMLDARFRWVIDPLDGTTNFAHDMPTFAVSIGLERDGQPYVGAIYDPMRDEMYLGSPGFGATLNGAPIQPSQVSTLLGSMLATGFTYDLAARERQAATWLALLVRVQAVRQTGSSALNMCYVACGRLDGYWERGIKAWDTAAGAAIAIAAGATVTDFAGNPFQSEQGEVLVANSALHPAMQEVILANDAPPIATNR